MISDSWTWIFGFLQSVGGAATGGALVFVGMQTLLMRRQMNSSFRPWLGVYQEGLVEEPQSQLLLRVTNYGSLPMTSLRILWKDSQGTINRNDIKSLGTNSDPYITAIFPNQIWEKTLPIEASLLDSAKKREASMFIGVLINYKYANNRSGEYGIIFRYGTILPKFVGKIIQINHICILVNLREPAIELKNILLISLNYVSLYYRDSQMPSELPASKLSKMSYGEISYPKL